MKKVILLAVIFSCLVAAPVIAKDINFAWDANSESDLAGYRLYQSGTSGSYTYGSGNEVAEIPAGTEVCTIDAADGTWYWVLTAYDTNGNESGPSNEVSANVDQTAPESPINLHFQ